MVVSSILLPYQGLSNHRNELPCRFLDDYIYQTDLLLSVEVHAPISNLFQCFEAMNDMPGM